MTRKLLFPLFLALFTLTALACGGGYQAPSAVPTTLPEEEIQGEVIITASYPRFQPSTITAAKGQVLRLKASATDMDHTFTIDELVINIALKKGQMAPRDIKVEKAGTFTFYCTVPGHRGAGMQGTLKVAE